MNAPKLRFPEFNDALKFIPLSELGEFKRSYSFSRALEGAGVVRHIHYGDIHMKLPTVITNAKILPTINVEQDFSFVKDGDILFADASEDYADLGKAVMINISDEHKIIAGLHTHLFSPIKKIIDSNYLVRSFQTRRYTKFIKKVGTGISVLGLSKNNLKDYSIALPIINEQQKTADFFVQLDQRIQKQNEKVELLKQQKKGLMQKIFSQELRFKDEDGKEYPEWTETNLGNVADVSKLAGFEFTKYINYADSGEIIALRGLNIKNESIILDDVKYIDNSNFTKLNRSKLFCGDILFTYVGTIGELAIVDQNDRYYLAPNVCRIRPSIKVTPMFLLNYMGQEDFRKKIIEPLVTTSSQASLSMESVRKFKISLPSIKEQEKIGKIFAMISLKTQKEQLKLDTFVAQKIAFMQQMFI